MIQLLTPPQLLALLVSQRLNGRYMFSLAPSYLYPKGIRPLTKVLHLT